MAALTVCGRCGRIGHGHLECPNCHRCGGATRKYIECPNGCEYRGEGAAEARASGWEHRGGLAGTHPAAIHGS